MSWSQSYSGTAGEVIAAARADRERIEGTLPEFEKGDVGHAIDAAEQAVAGTPEGAQISLGLAGHGWRDTTGKGGGAVSVSVNYSLAPAVQVAE